MIQISKIMGRQHVVLHVLYFPSFGSHFTYPSNIQRKAQREIRDKIYHLGAILETGKGHFCHGVLFVRCLLRGKERGVGGQGEVDTREAIKTRQQTRLQERKVTNNSRDKIGLKLIQVDVEGTIKAERGSDGRDDLRDQSVQVREARLRDIEAMLADIVDGLVVHLSNRHQHHNHRHRKATRRYAP